MSSKAGTRRRAGQQRPGAAVGESTTAPSPSPSSPSSSSLAARATRQPKRQQPLLQSLLLAPAAQPEDPRVQDALFALEQSWTPVRSLSRARSTSAPPHLPPHRAPRQTPGPRACPEEGGGGGARVRGERGSCGRGISRWSRATHGVPLVHGLGGEEERLRGRHGYRGSCRGEEGKRSVRRGRRKGKPHLLQLGWREEGRCGHRHKQSALNLLTKKTILGRRRGGVARRADAARKRGCSLTRSSGKSAA